MKEKRERREVITPKEAPVRKKPAEDPHPSREAPRPSHEPSEAPERKREKVPA